MEAIQKGDVVDSDLDHLVEQHLFSITAPPP
jgi:hypothetical protein